jgi:hypothetical protein
MTSVAGVGFWEHVDLLNLVAPFLEASAIGALSCTCRFARDNLHDPMQLRWLAELRGLDPERSGISSVEHIHIAEALSSMQTSVAFEYQSVRLVPAALPSVRRVADLLLQHTSLSISVEAHGGLEASSWAPTDAGRLEGGPDRRRSTFHEAPRSGSQTRHGTARAGPGRCGFPAARPHHHTSMEQHQAIGLGHGA